MHFAALFNLCILDAFQKQIALHHIYLHFRTAALCKMYHYRAFYNIGLKSLRGC